MCAILPLSIQAPIPVTWRERSKTFGRLTLLPAVEQKRWGAFHSWLVAAARLAFCDANLSIVPEMSRRTGICFGTSVAGLVGRRQGVQDFAAGGPGVIKPWTALEYPPHAAASYVAIELGINGPALTVSSNCCTGVDAISIAARQIASGQAEIAIAGSADAPIFPTIFDAFCTAPGPLQNAMKIRRGPHDPMTYCETASSWQRAVLR